MGFHSHDHKFMIAAPAGEAAPQTIYKTEDGIVLAYGTTVPTDATTGYAEGCIFIHVDGTTGTAVYINEGSDTSCDFNAVITNENLTTIVSGSNLVSEIESTELADTAAGASPSPNIWNACPWLQYALGADNGLTYWNHFDGNYVLANNQAATDLGFGVAGFTGATAGQTIAMETDEPTGAIVLNSSNDNETTGISIGGGLNTAGQYVIKSGKKFWMECRLKMANITDAKAGVFVGLAEEALLSEGGIIADGGTLTDKDLVGFWRLEGDGDKMDTYHNTAGGGETTEIKADAVTLEADTYIKLGMYFDGTTLTFYADGVALADTVDYDATNFPNGEEAAFYIVIGDASDDDFSVTVDWVRIAQEI